MRVYKVGRFEVETWTALVRASLGTVVATGLALTPHLERFAARAARRLLALDEEVNGLEHVAPNTAYMVTPLHEGFADALLLAHLPLDLTFVAREELFDWPLLGRLLAWSGQIRVDPETRATGYRRLLDEVKAVAQGGASVVMFPQGSILGIEAGFRSGPFRIADRLALPILPVVLTGTHRVWEHPYSDRLRFGQQVEMTVLEPLPPGTGVARISAIQAEMKRVALREHRAPARRFDPARDGYWDDYSYEIDPAFPGVAAQVAQHRSAVSR